MGVPGVYFDGEVAADRAVIVTLTDQGLSFSGSVTPVQHWRFSELVAVEPPLHGRPLRLTAEAHGGARLIINDENMKAAIVHHATHLRGGINPHRVKRLVMWTAGGIAVLVAGLYLVLQLVPQRLAFMLPDTWRNRVGAQIEISLTKGARQCGNGPGQAAIAALMARLAEGNPNLPATAVKVYDVPVMNAFAMPGGRIVVTRELIAKASSPDEVAGVLAHELGHVTLRHSEAQLVRATGLQVLLSLATGGGSDTIGSLAGLAAILRYSRDAEKEADDFALATLAAARIDPMGLRHFFELVLKEQGKSTTGTFGKIESALATHPGTEDRINHIHPLPEGAVTRPSLTEPQWQALKGICG